MPDAALLDFLAKLGLGATSVLLVCLLLIEQRRHDKTRETYAKHEQERIAVQRERIAADRDQTKVLTELSVRLSWLMGQKP